MNMLKLNLAIGYREQMRKVEVAQLYYKSMITKGMLKGFDLQLCLFSRFTSLLKLWSELK